MRRKATPKTGSSAKPRRASRPNPFGPLPDWHNNACVNNYMQFEELAEHYRDSADALVRCTARNRKSLDVHIYAICFLYRHSCELLLKGPLWQSEYALTGEKGIWKTHRLRTLWGGVERNGRKLLGTDFPLTGKECAGVKRLFAYVEEHDLDSDAFRYPINKDRLRTHPSLTNVNVRELRQAVREVSELLGRIVPLVDHHYTQRSEMERGRT